MILLDNTEQEISLKHIKETLRNLEDVTENKRLFHQLFVPLLLGMNLDNLDIVRIIRDEVVAEETIMLNMFGMRKAFIDAKRNINAENEAETIHLAFEFMRGIGFSTFDSIKVFAAA